MARPLAPLVHGTIRAYRDRGCRCQPCKAANAKEQREYQARRKAKAASPAAKAASAPEFAAWFRLKPQHPHTHRWQLDAPKGRTVRQCCAGCLRVKYVSADPGADRIVAQSTKKRGRPRKVAA